jgi:hypothetical protein
MNITRTPGSILRTVSNHLRSGHRRRSLSSTSRFISCNRYSEGSQLQAAVLPNHHQRPNAPCSRRLIKLTLAIFLPRVAGVGANIYSDAVNGMPSAHLIFTSNAETALGGGWLCWHTHLPDRPNKPHLCSQRLRMEPCWRLLPSQHAG